LAVDDRPFSGGCGGIGGAALESKSAPTITIYNRDNFGKINKPIEGKETR